MMNASEAIQGFQQFCSSVNQSSVLEFLTWVKENIDGLLQEADHQKRDNSDVILESIQEEVRCLMPIGGISSTETIVTPVVGLNSDCDPSTTLHVDAFCYDDEAIDDLCDEGIISRNYCEDCKSRNIKPLTFITHSASVKQIKYIFQHLLPADLSGKCVVDVGSRTGAILYGACLYSNAQSVVGIEIDPSFCDIQANIINKYQFSERIKVIHDDVLNCGAILSTVDVIILNNVFEFFMRPDLQRKIWEFLYTTLRKSGALLVTVPAIEESLQSLECSCDIANWLKPLDTKAALDRGNLALCGAKDDSDLDSIYLYQVL